MNLRYIQLTKLNFKLRSLQVACRSVSNKTYEAEALNDIGLCNENFGQYKEALKANKDAFKIWEEIDDSSNIEVKEGHSNTLLNIGNIPVSMGEPKEGVKYSKDALKIKEEIGNKYGISLALCNIGNSHAEDKSYDLALKYINESLQVSREIGNISGLASAFNWIGVILTRTGKYDEAIEKCTEALKIAEEIGDKNHIGNAKFRIMALKAYNSISEEYRTYFDINEIVKKVPPNKLRQKSDATHLVHAVVGKNTKRVVKNDSGLVWELVREKFPKFAKIYKNQKKTKNLDSLLNQIIIWF